MRQFALRPLIITIVAASTFAQEQSVRPGINESFRDPDPKQFTERFEIESREVYARRKEIVDAMKLKPTDTIADIGAGTGLFTRLFASTIGPEGRVIAVDIAQKFLNHIEVTCREGGLRNVDTLLCKEDSTELPPESVDVAFICDTYHHFEFPHKTMASLLKAMKPGGRVIVIDFKRIEGESSEWTLNHVRAGQDVFEAEIISAGFRRSEEVKDLLTENYMVVFEKVLKEQPTSEASAPPGRRGRGPGAGRGPGGGRGMNRGFEKTQENHAVSTAKTSHETAVNSELKFPIIEGYGGVAAIEDGSDPPRSGMKVVLDVTSEAKDSEEINRGLDRAARLLNLYGVTGMSSSDLKLTVVLHGEATGSVLSDAAWKSRTQSPHNPNVPLIQALQKAGVEVLVCGQALNYKGITRDEVTSEVPVAVAAITVLLNRQADGYSYVSVP